MAVRSSRASGWACAALLVAAIAAAPRAAAAPVAPQQGAGAHGHAEAAKLKNPTRADAASLAAGKKLYDTQCASCHGATGKGDGKGGALLKPLPSDLTDAAWKHGSSEGEIFIVLRDGVKQTGMRGYGGRLQPQDLWHLVNYVRTLAPKPKPTR